MVEEQWKDVPGYEGRYTISDHGRVYSLLTKKVLAERRVDGDYVQYALSHATLGRRVQLAHTLVLEAFVGPRPVGMVGRHRDGTRDNRLSNLAWGTESENAIDRVQHGFNNSAQKTHCPKNHPYDAANTIHRNGRRFCRACRNAGRRAVRARRAA